MIIESFPTGHTTLLRSCQRNSAVCPVYILVTYYISEIWCLTAHSPFGGLDDLAVLQITFVDSHPIFLFHKRMADKTNTNLKQRKCDANNEHGIPIWKSYYIVSQLTVCAWCKRIRYWMILSMSSKTNLLPIFCYQSAIQNIIRIVI